MQDNRRNYEGGRWRSSFDRPHRDDQRFRQPYDDPRYRDEDEPMYAERYRGEDRSWRDQADGYAQRSRRPDDTRRTRYENDDVDFPEGAAYRDEYETGPRRELHPSWERGSWRPQESGGFRDRYGDDFTRGRHQTQAVGTQQAGWGGWRSGWSGAAPEPDYTGRGPKNYQRSDDRIREEVSDRLTDDPRIDASEIVVDVRSGEVTLTGSVGERDQKRRAEDLAERVTGVREVHNNIRVSRPSDQDRQNEPRQKSKTPVQA